MKTPPPYPQSPKPCQNEIELTAAYSKAMQDAQLEKLSQIVNKQNQQ